ncbi:MAG: VWA domain-containing protein [Verrucomicrobia bacterium]|nr:VWA domain-containing protein [Verrucomicrobiota bacterium]
MKIPSSDPKRLSLVLLMLALAACSQGPVYQSNGYYLEAWAPTRSASAAHKSLKSRPKPMAAPSMAPAPPVGGYTKPEAESYAKIRENEFVRTAERPVSTFGADVDTASYANLRRMIRDGDEVPQGAVRLEEMLNYFPYDYPQPAPGEPFAVKMETAECPWKPGDRLLKIALRTRDVAPAARPPANLVFLVDVSGSMEAENKLPLVRKGLLMLAETLRPQDRISMVTYAGESGLVLPSTSGDRKFAIRRAIGRLSAGGSTNGGEGIELAYRIAGDNFIRGGVNRVILATDGDFNVGVTDGKELERLISAKAKNGVFLSVLGFGMGNLKDDTLETLADKGNGNYAYIDTREEAEKVLVADASGTLLTVAKDVKLQLEWNGSAARRYRLLGYENRVMAGEDFANDRKDSGDMGAGQRVTVLYQYEPATDSGTLATLRIRHKLPEASRSELSSHTCPAAGTRAFADATPDFRFASAVAAFGMALRASPHAGGATRESILEWAQGALADDPGGLRREFVGLVKKARIPERGR